MLATLNIAVLLHSGVGGSGVVATELGVAMAAAGHSVHFVADRPPFRLAEFSCEGVFFHEVDSLSYPLFPTPLTTLSETSKLVEVIEEVGIDLVHAHYAVPHATAALLAREMARTRPGPAVVTTLHGTDVTLVGMEPAYLRTTQYSIERSDVVTAVSHYLARATKEVLSVDREIQVIPNPVDVARFRPDRPEGVRARYAGPEERLLVHVSNFRPVKQVRDVVDVFARVAERVPARLLMIGDGPDRPSAFHRADELGVSDRVSFLGTFPRVENLLPLCDLFLLPSSSESFGLAALEAMSSGVPVIASTAGGIPEVVDHGVNGYLYPTGDVDAMADAAVDLLSDPDRLASFARAARDRAFASFRGELILPQYLAAYRKAIALRGKYGVASTSSGSA